MKDKNELILKEAENNLKESERIVCINLNQLMQMDLELTNKKIQKNYDKQVQMVNFIMIIDEIIQK